jgi:hypothetical protein
MLLRTILEDKMDYEVHLQMLGKNKLTFGGVLYFRLKFFSKQILVVSKAFGNL